MKFFCWTICSLVLFASSTSVANNNAIQQERFSKYLNDLKSVFVTSSGDQKKLEDAVSSLLRGTKRVSAYNLQALGKIYSNFQNQQTDYSYLFNNTIRYEFKAIEDAIGEVKQHEEHLDDDDLSEKNKLKYERYKAAATEILKYVLTSDDSYLEGFIPEDYRKPEGKKVKVEDHITREGKKVIETFRKLSGLKPNPEKNISEKELKKIIQKKSLFAENKWYPYNSDSKLFLLEQALKTFDWPEYNTDRSYLISELSTFLEDLAETEYDFHLLENGDNDEKGLHEYRREVRWFAFEAGILNGTVSVADSNNCPIESYKNIVFREDLQKSNYSKLPTTPFPEQEKVCYISKCLYYKITDIISVFGDLKDDSKKYNKKNDIEENKTPKKYRKEAEDISQEVKDNKLFETIASELNSCI